MKSHAVVSVDPTGVFLSKTGLASWENGCSVTILWLCIGTTSSLRSFFRWLHDILPWFRVSFFPYSAVIPISSPCPAKNIGFRLKHSRLPDFWASVTSVLFQTNRKPLEDFASWIKVFFWNYFLFRFQFIQLNEKKRLLWGMILNFAGMLFCCSALFLRGISLRYVVRFWSPSGSKLRVAVSIGLMNLDCSGVTMLNLAVCLLFVITKSHLVVLVTLLAKLLVNYGRLWLRNQPSCFFSKIIQGNHATYCVPFWKKFKDCF